MIFRTAGGNSKNGMNRCQASRHTRTVAGYFLPQSEPSKMSNSWARPQSVAAV